MTTQQPPAQQDYLTELHQIGSALSRAYLRLTALMKTFPYGPKGQLPDEWHDCYLASQAVHLGNQLLSVARDNEQARREPVPFLPVEPAAQSHLRAILDDVLGDGS